MALIEIEGIKKIYDKDGAATEALRGISFSIGQGEFVAIIGPSGSGKSTLLQILGLLDGYTSGRYILNGVDVGMITDDDIASLRNNLMGFIFQSFNLLARTSVLENVKLPFMYSQVKESDWDLRAKKQIELVGLSQRLSHESNELSGGERQRVAIARALVNNPGIIFADEPTGNLDSNSGKAVMDILEGLHHQGHTVILITHDRSIAKRAHRALLIQDGELRWDGDPSQLPEY
jgi:putative ABC transport system ATP-binding protein